MPAVDILLKSIGVFLPLVFAMSPASGQDALGGSRPLKQALARHAAHLSRSVRIFGGIDAKIQDNPWQVALVDSSDSSNTDAQFCGGSIVAVRWVLTAAHCVDAGTKASQIAVLAGTDSLNAGGRRISVLEDGIYIYKPWDFTKHSNDIALLHVADNLPGQPIRPWSLPTSESENLVVRVTGWGALSWQNLPPVSILLQEVDTQVIALKKCNSSDSWDGLLTDKMLCIGKYDTGQQDSCERDSGGPATADVNGSREIIGITSFGAPHCGTPKMPGIYTRVSQYTNWVRSTSQGEVAW
jgi:secreted trypsin-like serine protease